MTGSVAGAVQEVERAVLKVVDGAEATNVEVGVEVEFMDWTAGGVGVEEGRERVGWIGGLKDPSDAGADDERDGRRKGRWVTDVVEVVMRPDDGGDIGTSDFEVGRIGVEDCRDVLLGFDVGCCFNKLYGAGGVVLLIMANAQVEENVPITVCD